MGKEEMPLPRGYWMEKAKRMNVGSYVTCKTDSFARYLTRALKLLGHGTVRKTGKDGSIKVWRTK